MEKDVASTFVGLGNPGNSEAAQAVEDANALGVSPDTGAEDTGQAKDTPVDDSTVKEPDAEGLTDEQFDKLIARMVSDPKSPYNKNKAWQRIISQRDTHSKRADSMLARLAKSNPQAARELLLDEGMPEDEVDSHLESMGADLSVTTPKTQEASGIDLEFVNLLKGMNIDYDTLTPEQRQYWKFQYQFNRQMMQPVQKFISDAQSEKKKQEVAKIQASFGTEEKELQELCKTKYAMNWDNEVVPELENYLKEHPQFVGTPKQLFSIVFFDKGEELGKKAKAIEDSKLNEEKKRIKSEEPGSTGKGTSIPEGVGKNFNKTWDWTGRNR